MTVLDYFQTTGRPMVVYLLSEWTWQAWAATVPRRLNKTTSGAILIGPLALRGPVIWVNHKPLITTKYVIILREVCENYRLTDLDGEWASRCHCDFFPHIASNMTRISFWRKSYLVTYTPWSRPVTYYLVTVIISTWFFSPWGTSLFTNRSLIICVHILYFISVFR